MSVLGLTWLLLCKILLKSVIMRRQECGSNAMVTVQMTVEEYLEMKSRQETKSRLHFCRHPRLDRVSSHPEISHYSSLQNISSCSGSVWALVQTERYVFVSCTRGGNYSNCCKLIVLCCTLARVVVIFVKNILWKISLHLLMRK